MYSGLKAKFTSHSPKSPPVRPVPLASVVLMVDKLLDREWNSECRWAVTAETFHSLDNVLSTVRHGSHLDMCCTLQDSSGVGLAALWELACCPEEGNTAGRLCCSSPMPPFAAKMVPVSGVKCCAGGEGGRSVGRASLYHRKVSAVEPPPGASRLTSTLTQATFSWLSYRDEEKRRWWGPVHTEGGAQLQMWDWRCST